MTRLLLPLLLPLLLVLSGCTFTDSLTDTLVETIVETFIEGDPKHLGRTALEWASDLDSGSPRFRREAAVAIGLLAVVLTSRGIGPEWRSFLITGTLGSYTTYSAFSLDAVLLLENGDWPRAAGYVAATVFCCLAGCGLGLVAGRSFI